MITLNTPFSPDFIPTLPPEQKNRQALYFDIETTGLSAQSSYVYLIGCAYRKDEDFILTQWLCTEPSEEKELLRLFFDKAKDYDLLLHYNGTGFDLPFLEKKAKRHCLTSPLSSMESLDLYNTARSLKHLFPLPNLKLKTMEQFFGLPRTDIFSGGDLIEVYAQFLGLHHLNTLTNNSKTQEETALGHVLLLHNAEDIKNLPSLTVLFFLQNLANYLKEENLCVTSYEENSSLHLSYSLPFAVPKDFSLCLPWMDAAVFLAFEGQTLSLRLPILTGEFKHFYPNPADYYYLPLEDCAMHKSVAAFVEKEYRKKATAATCYTKKAGAFLPLYKTASGSKTAQTKKEVPCEASASLPHFFSEYKSNYCYTPFSEEIVTNKTLLLTITQSILSTLI